MSPWRASRPPPEAVRTVIAVVVTGVVTGLLSMLGASQLTAYRIERAEQTIEVQRGQLESVRLSHGSLSATLRAQSSHDEERWGEVKHRLTRIEGQLTEALAPRRRGGR